MLTNSRKLCVHGLFHRFGSVWSSSGWQIGQQNAKNEYSGYLSVPDTSPIAMNVDIVENDMFINFFASLEAFKKN